MKRVMSVCLVTILLLSIFATTIAIAGHSYAGSVWTGKPTILGLGYYCTAARNDSGGNTSSHWAWARTYYSGKKAYTYKPGNDRAVASSGSVHPTKGEGQWGETGYSIPVAKFKSSAYD
ncbi:hypothetical protein JS518_15405 [Clostridiales bacterium FE2010]|nr:hypothetical protein JS518_15405 [Clostridiales bacterium FE2010]